MSYYDNQQWPATGQAAWEHQTPPARSGASSVAPREDSTAFSSQLEEVDRAIENLFKSGKAFNAPVRRESMPLGTPARSFPEQYGGPPRHTSVGGEFSGDARSFSASNLQSFYATQRHQPARGASEAEQVLQAKRRMAAQRERELRNYHQEQQYNRTALAELSAFGTKPDRALSPSTMSDDERRDLIARQRSALYGDSTFPEGSFVDENGVTRQATPAQPGRGHSPLAFEAPAPKEGAAIGTPTGQGDERTSPFENANSSAPRASSSSPSTSPPHTGKPAQNNGGVAPIGTRPTANNTNSNANPAMTATAQKGRTTPLPSPLSYGFGAQQQSGEEAAGKEKEGGAPGSGAMGWGKGAGGVWGKGALGVQASVWG